MVYEYFQIAFPFLLCYTLFLDTKIESLFFYSQNRFSKMISADSKEIIKEYEFQEVDNKIYKVTSKVREDKHYKLIINVLDAETKEFRIKINQTKHTISPEESYDANAKNLHSWETQWMTEDNLDDSSVCNKEWHLSLGPSSRLTTIFFGIYYMLHPTTEFILHERFPNRWDLETSFSCDHHLTFRQTNLIISSSLDTNWLSRQMVVECPVECVMGHVIWYDNRTRNIKKTYVSEFNKLIKDYSSIRNDSLARMIVAYLF